jgi:alpha-tubulin suppressor-like RCC1 family protein
MPRVLVVVGLVACGSNAPTVTPLSGSAAPTSKVRSVSVGSLHACAAMADGSVRCWGHNEDGQVTGTKSEPVRTPTAVPGVANIASVRLDGRISDAIRSDGSVVGWGNNRAGVVENPPGEGALCTRGDNGVVRCEYEEGKPVTLANTIAMASGSATCALLRDDSVQCIGANQAGQLADGTTEFRPQFGVVPGVKRVAQLVSAGGWVCVRHTDAAVTCWGGDVSRGMVFTAPTRVEGITDAAELFAGGEGVCARRASGAVACWGWIAARSDDLPEFDRIVAKPVPWLDGATAMSFTDLFGCAVVHGDVVCWGDNTSGQLGDGTVERRETAAPVRW